MFPPGPWCPALRCFIDCGNFNGNGIIIVHYFIPKIRDDGNVDFLAVVGGEE